MTRLTMLLILLSPTGHLLAQESFAASADWLDQTRSIQNPLEPLTSDRPGFTDTVNALPNGLLQIESGFSLNGATNGATAQRTWIGGSPLVRLGVGHRLELRFGGAGYEYCSQRTGENGSHVAGLSDLSVGVKFELAAEHSWRPALALESMISLPAGAASFTSSGTDPTFKLAWSKTIHEGLAASGNFDVSSLSTPLGRYRQRAVSGRLDRGVWRKLAGFGEAYLVAPLSRDGNRIWMLDGGVAHPLGSNAQLDVSVGQQITPGARCWFVAAGVVARNPLWRGGHK